MQPTHPEHTIPQGKGRGQEEPSPAPPRGHAYLLLSLDPHVLCPLLAVLALVGAARLALHCLQPRGPRSHHLHGRHAATTALQEKEQGGGWTWDHARILGPGLGYLGLGPPGWVL